MDIIATNNDGDIEVIWKFDGKVHIVEYGTQSETYYDDLLASECFGYCIRHSLECAGKLGE